MWWLHGPPSTENHAKIPYKSMTVGTEHGEARIEPTRVAVAPHLTDELGEFATDHCQRVITDREGKMAKRKSSGKRVLP